MARWGTSKAIAETTARRWLKDLDFRYGTPVKGQYIDGHERADVVEYRQNVFIPKWEEFQKRMILRDNDGNIVQMPPPGQLVIPQTHDESTFYAHDQRKSRWIHISEGPTPVRKGEGTSIMVSDFCSPDNPNGWLRSEDGFVAFTAACPLF